MSMRILHCLLVVVLSTLTATCGFNTDNPNFCPGANPNNNCHEIDAGSDGPQSCANSSECTAPTSVCDVAETMTCVQCTTTEDDACKDASPVCGADHTCRGCTAHAECAATSNVCLPDGSCADEAEVAYVQAGATGTCDKASPCGTMTLGIAKNRPFVKVGVGVVNDATTTAIIRAVTILADPGASINVIADDVPVLSVATTTADVKIFDLTITGGTMAGGAGINVPTGGTPKLSLTRATVTGNAGGGISATAGSVTVGQSTVSNNAGGGISATGGTVTISQSTISSNTGGGISIDGGQYEITNCIIASNGSGASTRGGIEIDGIVAAGTHRLEFNTITANLGPATINTGITCGTVLTPITFSNNIVFDNIVSGGGKQIGGSANCTATFSDVGPDPAVGTGNINANPMFVDVAQRNFHIMSGSPARNSADPAATLAVDFDGDARPEGNTRDMGADEAP